MMLLSITRRVTGRLLYIAPALLLTLTQLPVVAQQAPAQVNGAGSANWADEVLKTEGYVTPPKELADAVLAPRHLNVSLTTASPDKKWFLDEIGDGPVLMKTFSKPFHELGGVFIDFKANRARALTIRNNVGIQIISAADGSKKTHPDSRRRARLERRLVARQQQRRVLRRTPTTATHIWIADVATGKSRQVTKTPVLATLVSSFEFTADGKQIAAVLDPRRPRRRCRVAPSAPHGPDGEDRRRRQEPPAHVSRA